MAICRIDEFDRAPTGDHPGTRLLKSKEYTTSGAAVLSDAFQQATGYIEIMCDGNVYYEEGRSPVAAPANEKSQLLFSSSYRPIYPTGVKNKISIIDK